MVDPSAIRTTIVALVEGLDARMTAAGYHGDPFRASPNAVIEPTLFNNWIRRRLGLSQIEYIISRFDRVDESGNEAAFLRLAELLAKMKRGV